MALYTVETTGDQEAGLTAARLRNPDYADQDNAAYVAFVMGSAFDSYVAAATDEQLVKFGEQLKEGDPAAVAAAQAAAAAVDAKKAAEAKAAADAAAAEAVVVP